jgi:hypothetical protein
MYVLLCMFETFKLNNQYGRVHTKTTATINTVPSQNQNPI